MTLPDLGRECSGIASVVERTKRLSQLRSSKRDIWIFLLLSFLSSNAPELLDEALNGRPPSHQQIVNLESLRKDVVLLVANIPHAVPAHILDRFAEIVSRLPSLLLASLF
jgi:hypothetical protein